MYVDTTLDLNEMSITGYNNMFNSPNEYFV